MSYGVQSPKLASLLASPKGPYTQIVCVYIYICFGLKSTSFLGTLGLKYIVFGYMDP